MSMTAIENLTTLSAAQQADIVFEAGVDAQGVVTSPSFQSWNRGSSPITYASTTYFGVWNNDANGVALSTDGYHRPAGEGGGVVTYAFDPSADFTAAEQQAFVSSLTLWSDEVNITFEQVSNSTTADLLLERSAAGGGTYESGSPTYGATVGSNALAVDVTPTLPGGGQAAISFDSSGGYGTLGSFADTANAGYSYSAIVHEIGHVLGLGHTGPYNDGTSEDADPLQFNQYDSRLWSVMSYINPQDTAAAFYSQYPVTETNWTYYFSVGQQEYYSIAAPQTPQMDDILAAQLLYGPSTSTTLAGGQVFGFDCNITDAAEPFFDFTKNVTPVVTLYDTGLGNTLDLSGYTMACMVNLNPGSFSSVDGLTNNIGIAYGTRIDTAIGGSGNDSFVVNADSDTINGGGGVNTAIFSGDEASYLISDPTPGVVVVTDGSIVDTLTDIQDLQFADGSISTLCFAAGTRIATPNGERPIETLCPGDLVIAASADGARVPQAVRWVGCRRLDLAAHPDPDLAAPVRIRAGAIAPGVPCRDLLLSPDHCVLIDGHLLRAFRMINGVSVVQEHPSHVTYLHVELDRHALLLAESVLAESYLDEGCRDFFARGAGSIPGPLRHRTHAACAPFVPDDVFAAGVWRRIAGRAGVAAPPPVAARPTVRVLAGDRPLRPIVTQGQRQVFAVPRDTRQVRLVSATVRPTAERPWAEDRRRLGVAVRRITVDEGQAVPLDSPALTTGWWDCQAGTSRWTDGDAWLDLPSGSRLLELRCG